MKKTLMLVLITELWMTIAQICFKKSANHLSLEAKDPRQWVAALLKAVLQTPLLWAGIALMLGGMLFWFAALSSGDLSFVYLLGSVQYVIMLAFARWFLKEDINAGKLIGTLLITLGIILTAISK